MQPSIDIPELDGLPKNVQVPTKLVNFRGLSLQPLLALMAMWQMLGQRAGLVQIDFALLGMALQASERSCRRWIQRLSAAGLVVVVDRRPRGATIRVRDWRIELSMPPPLPDGRQYGLDFGDDADDVTPDTLQIWRTGQLHGGTNFLNHLQPADAGEQSAQKALAAMKLKADRLQNWFLVMVDTGWKGRVYAHRELVTLLFVATGLSEVQCEKRLLTMQEEGHWLLRDDGKIDVPVPGARALAPSTAPSEAPSTAPSEAPAAMTKSAWSSPPAVPATAPEQQAQVLGDTPACGRVSRETETETRDLDLGARQEKNQGLESQSAAVSALVQIRGARPIGVVAEEVANSASALEQDAAREGVEATVRRLIERGGRGGGPDGNGELLASTARKIAMALADGWLHPATVKRVLDDADSHVKDDPVNYPAPWCYIVGTMPYVFADAGHAWFSDGRKLPKKPLPTGPPKPKPR